MSDRGCLSPFTLSFYKYPLKVQPGLGWTVRGWRRVEDVRSTASFPSHWLSSIVPCGAAQWTLSSNSLPELRTASRVLPSYSIPAVLQDWCGWIAWKSLLSHELTWAGTDEKKKKKAGGGHVMRGVGPRCEVTEACLDVDELFESLQVTHSHNTIIVCIRYI